MRPLARALIKCLSHVGARLLPSGEGPRPGSGDSPSSEVPTKLGLAFEARLCGTP